MKKKKRITIPIESTSGVKFHYISNGYMRWDLKDDLSGQKVRLVWSVEDLAVIRNAINAYFDHQEARALQQSWSLDPIGKGKR
jgi:tRNA threonylcarbamoyladenosine modification (KEOPS) complex  Pcc1 subunit